ncbi:hypothetical protein RM704_25530 [Streptomyces sp. DSM 3412]|uniref:Uncharacterized protein n=1 Tax=Streptomyces gottesmaniae TaxID=3075518 RepID=A0ABU2Z2H0_9ACTN|nr:hypothetical protein [Streptomyces sp. DSM 3412]MDT0570778.1 hypothetical protein [Streptomyces sp. DSM 3412]
MASNADNSGNPSNPTGGHRHRPGRASDGPGDALGRPGRAPDISDISDDALHGPTDRSRAARHRSLSPASPASPTSPTSTGHHPGPRPRVEVTVNELTGTVSWRTLARPTHAPAAQDGTPGTVGAPGTPHRRTTATEPQAAAPSSARAAAFRSAGLDPSRAPAKGAAPIPTHPGAVRAALSADVGALTPERGSSRLARIGALRSAVAADLARGAGMPTSVASRLRSTTATPAHTHALTARHATAVTRPPTPAPTHHRSL